MKKTEETVKGFQLCCKYDKLGWLSTEGDSATGWKNRSSYSCVLVDERNLARDGKEIMVGDIQDGIDGV